MNNYIIKNVFLGVLLAFSFSACTAQKSGDKIEDRETSSSKEKMNAKLMNGKYEEATLGAGCFWCIEAIYDELQGVESVEAGYAGGSLQSPTYKDICGGNTGHAEVIRIVFDPEKVSYAEILEIFWTVHDPTTLNRQGNDVGTQYRSVIFYHGDAQKAIAEESLKIATDAGLYEDPIVTEITAINNYYEAENYHQEYFANNPNQPYCSFVVRPKIEKFRKMYKDRLK